MSRIVANRLPILLLSVTVVLGLVAAQPADAASSSRKGVSATSVADAGSDISNVGASWYYDWSPSTGSIARPAGTEFVPMIWGAAEVDPTDLATAEQQGTELLAFNEPDQPGQTNMTVEQALDLWPQLEATGMRLGAPAVSYGADTPGGWLDQFMSGAAARGYRVDFIPLHWYGGDFSSAATGELQSYLQAVYDRYHKPIWLTEFGLANFGTGQFPAGAQQAAFVTAAVKMLDGLPFVQRYAWFALPANNTDGSLGLFSGSGQATETGRAFEAAGRS